MSQISFNEKSNRTLSEFDFLQDPNDKNSKLGVGSFSCVKLAREKKTSRLHALKIVSINPSKVTASDMHNLRTEIHVHKKLDHPNIIRFYDFIRHENNVYLVLDYAENGNLYSYLHKKKILSENEVFKFFYQATSAIQYLHENDILHRDIKPENLLLDKSFNIKLCDFGWSAQRIHEKRLTFCGTYEYMAPEIIHKRPYDYRVDIWSLGILLFELFHREPPFKGRSLPEITQSLAKTTIQYSSSLNSEAKDLIKSILKINPSERPSITEILSHPWVKSHLAKDDQRKVDDALSPRNSKLSIYSQSSLSSMNHPRQEEVQKENKPRPRNYTSERELSHESPALRVKSPNNQSTLRLDTENYKPKSIHDQTGLNLRTLGDQYNPSTTKNSMAKQMLENMTYDGKKTPVDLRNKKKSIETSLLSPNFKTKLTSIITQLSSQTTTHKSQSDINPLLSNRSPSHHKAIGSFQEMTSARIQDYQVPLEQGLHYSSSIHNYKSGSGSQINLNNLSPSGYKKAPLDVNKQVNSSKDLTQSKNSLKSKLNGLKLDENSVNGLTPSMSTSNLTTSRNRREISKTELTSSQIMLSDVSTTKHISQEDRSRSPNYQPSSNPLGLVDQNRYKHEETDYNALYKGIEHKRKSHFKSIDDYANNSSKQYATIDIKSNYQKDGRIDMPFKENKSPSGLDRIYSSRSPILKENY